MKKTATLTFLTFVTVLIVGCGAEDYSTSDAKPIPVEDQIKKIEADPHMPQRAKDAQIGAIRAAQEKGEGMRKGMEESQKK